MISIIDLLMVMKKIIIVMIIIIDIDGDEKDHNCDAHHHNRLLEAYLRRLVPVMKPGATGMLAGYIKVIISNHNQGEYSIHKIFFMILAIDQY